MNDIDKAPKEIDLSVVLGELEHRWAETAGASGGELPGVSWVLYELTELDILRFREPADDPSKDDLGTLRLEKHDDGHSVWLCTLDRHGRRGWFCVYSTALGNQGGRMEDSEVAGLSVLSALPESPAWEREQAEIEHTDLFEPEVVTAADIDAWVDAPPLPTADANAYPRYYQADESEELWRIDGPDKPPMWRRHPRADWMESSSRTEEQLVATQGGYIHRYFGEVTS